MSKEELAKRLDAALGQEVGIAGLNILLYGWKKYRKYGAKYCDALKHREWLYIVEVIDLSDYAGYDLAKRERNPFCKGRNLCMSGKSSTFALSFGEIG